MREIFNLQKTTHLLISCASFERVVREIASDIRSDLRMEPLAVSALHHAAEAFLVKRFQQANRAAAHAGRITVQEEDFDVVDDLCDK